MVEDKQKDDGDKEIKEIVETQRVIDEILVSNADAIKRLNKEMLTVQEVIANTNIEKDKDEIIQHESFGKQSKRICN